MARLIRFCILDFDFYIFIVEVEDETHNVVMPYSFCNSDDFGICHSSKADCIKVREKASSHKARAYYIECLRRVLYGENGRIPLRPLSV
jgi:hypothetical protein